MSGADRSAELVKVLEFYKGIGVERVPLAWKQAVEEFLSRSPKTGPGSQAPVGGRSARSVAGAVTGTPSQRSGDHGRQLEELRQQLGDCKRCGLSVRRTNIVFGSGNPDAELMFIGEGPGEDEDRQGLPFVGRAGELLTRMIQAMGYAREDVYIANVVKCRPPGNRNPEAGEVASCLPFLKKQIEIVSPKAIICLGKVSAHALFETAAPIGALRGAFRDYGGIPTMITYHPAYLLRSPSQKKVVWEDLQLVMKLLGKAPRS